MSWNSTTEPVCFLSLPVFMYTHSKKRTKGFLRTGSRSHIPKIYKIINSQRTSNEYTFYATFKSSEIPITFWQMDSMNKFSPSQQEARRSNSFSNMCKSSSFSGSLLINNCALQKYHTDIIKSSLDITYTDKIHSIYASCFVYYLLYDNDCIYTCTNNYLLVTLSSSKPSNSLQNLCLVLLKYLII